MIISPSRALHLSSSVAEVSLHTQRLGSVCKEKDILEAELRDSKAETSHLKSEVQEANMKVTHYASHQNIT